MSATALGSSSSSKNDFVIGENGFLKKIIKNKVTGSVKWFNLHKGFGFITREDTKTDLFVHHTSIKRGNPAKSTKTLSNGEAVEFDLVQGEKGLEAANVTGPNGVAVKGADEELFPNSHSIFGGGIGGLMGGSRGGRGGGAKEFAKFMRAISRLGAYDSDSDNDLMYQYDSDGEPRDPEEAMAMTRFMSYMRNGDDSDLEFDDDDFDEEDDFDESDFDYDDDEDEDDDDYEFDDDDDYEDDEDDDEEEEEDEDDEEDDEDEDEDTKNKKKQIAEIINSMKSKSQDSIHANSDESATTSKRSSLEKDATKSSKSASPEKCKLCDEEPIGVLFVPCKHEISCVECSTRLKRCTECRKQIEKKILIETGAEMIHKLKVAAAANAVTTSGTGNESLKGGELKQVFKKLEEIEEAQKCTICLDAKKQMVFNCGHLACVKCAKKLKLCHICRKYISRRTKIYVEA